MSKLIVLVLVAAALIAVGCKHHEGSREYIPGKGWVPND